MRRLVTRGCLERKENLFARVVHAISLAQRLRELALMDRFKSGRATIVISDLTLVELSLAPAAVQKVLDEVPVANRENIEFTREEMSELYARSDVVLKMSSVEGMFGPPLEGFHRGATCVVTPVSGHEEYVEHGWNGLLTDWEDLRGTARQLDLLRHRSYEPHVVQIHDPREAEPDLLGDVELYDVETEMVRKVTVTEKNLRQYRKLFADVVHATGLAETAFPDRA